MTEKDNAQVRTAGRPLGGSWTNLLCAAGCSGIPFFGTVDTSGPKASITIMSWSWSRDEKAPGKLNGFVERVKRGVG